MKIYAISKDHKPSELSEENRIIKAGGKIYQYLITIYRNTMKINGKNLGVGPKRVFPGQLSVSRTFGDPQAKLPCFSGKPGVVSAIPEIKAFKVLTQYDFIIMGSDGIYDKMSNKDVVRCVLKTLNEYKEEKNRSVHKVCGASVECIVKNSLMRKTLDNVTVVMIAFSHFKDIIEKKSEMNKRIENKQKFTPVSSMDITQKSTIIINGTTTPQ